MGNVLRKLGVRNTNRVTDANGTKAGNPAASLAAANKCDQYDEHTLSMVTLAKRYAGIIDANQPAKSPGLTSLVADARLKADGPVG
jgi:hypothetical protein